MDYTKIPRRAIRKFQKDGAIQFFNSGKDLLIEDIIFYSIVYKRLINECLPIIGRDDIKSSESCKVVEEFNEEIPEKGIPPSDDPTPKRMFAPGDRFVCSISDVTVLGPVGLGITQQGEIVSETVASPSLVSLNEHPRRIGVALSKSMAKNGVWKTTKALSPHMDVKGNDQISRASVLASPWDNYYHWTIECLIRIRLLEEETDISEEAPPLLVPEEMPTWMSETLELIDYDGSIIPWDGTILDVKKLIVPTFPDPIPSECFWLRDRMLSNVQSAESFENSKRIYVSREDATTRGVSNREEMVALLNKYDFEKYIMSELTVEEQIKLFSNAEIVLAPHGAGLTNIVYSDDITVIELVGAEKRGTFYRISQIVDHDYIYVNCDQEGLDLRVDVDQLESVLEDATTK